MPAHRHKLAVFPHRVVDGNRGQREEDNGRDTNTTNAGPGQADLVRPLATATVCLVSGLRIGTVLGGEPHGPGSPWIVKMMTATGHTENESPRSEGFFLESQQLFFYSFHDSARRFHCHAWPSLPRVMTDGEDAPPELQDSNRLKSRRVRAGGATLHPDD